MHLVPSACAAEFFRELCACDSAACVAAWPSGWGGGGIDKGGASGGTPLLALCLFLGGLCDIAVFSGAGPTFDGEVWACGDGSSVGLCCVIVSLDW